MEFKRARIEKQMESRQAEILNTCAVLYDEAGAEGVTIKAISERTSFSRPTIYNYYDTKEEILLDFLQRECTEFAEEVELELGETDNMTRETFCRTITNALIRREKRLPLMSVYLNSIENNVSDERLVAFKKYMTALFDFWQEEICRFFPDSSEHERVLFLNSHFCFVYGLYPMTHPSKKQVAAMEKAKSQRPEPFDTFCYEGLLRLAERL